MISPEISKEQVIDLNDFSLACDNHKVAFVAAATVSNGKKYTVYALGSRYSKNGYYRLRPTIFINKFNEIAKANLYHDKIEEIIGFQAWHGPRFVKDVFGRMGEIKRFYDFVRNENNKKMIR